MPWETREWATMPNDHVMKFCKGHRPIGKRVRIHLDPRSWEAEDANDLRVEGTYMACSSDGPTLYLEEEDNVVRGRIPLIDIAVIEEIPR
jgi:hypothetical protein